MIMWVHKEDGRWQAYERWSHDYFTHTIDSGVWVRESRCHFPPRHPGQMRTEQTIPPQSPWWLHSGLASQCTQCGTTINSFPFIFHLAAILLTILHLGVAMHCLSYFFNQCSKYWWAQIRRTLSWSIKYRPFRHPYK